MDYFNFRLYTAVLNFSLFLFCLACSSSGPLSASNSQSDFPKYNLKVKINDVGYRGVGVLPIVDKYNIKVKPEGGRIDRISWKTCAGGEIIDPDQGYFEDKDFDIEFSPLPIELNTTCFLEIIIFQKKTKRVGQALFDFQDRRKDVSLESIITCNRKKSQAKGVFICQAEVGSLTEVVLKEPVHVSGGPGCDMMNTIAKEPRGKFIFPMPISECILHLDAKGGKTFRLTTLGFNTVPVRE